MADYTITTYLCPILIPVTEFEGLDNLPAIEYENTTEAQAGLKHGKIIAKIYPAIPYLGCSITHAKINTKLCPDDKYCPYCNLTGVFSWRRPVRIIEFTLNIYYEYSDYIEITWNDPDHCHWRKSAVWLMSGPREGDHMWVYSLAIGEERIPIKVKYTCPNQRYIFTAVTSTWEPCGYEIDVPTSDIQPTYCPRCMTRLVRTATIICDKSEVSEGGTTHTAHGVEPFVVPGERMVLAWRFYNTESHTLRKPNTIWFHTPLLTGGKITEIIGEYGDISITYKVDIQGTEVVCIPSDFAHYEVDDWVYVMKTNDLNAKTCDREVQYGDCSGPIIGSFDTNEFIAAINADRLALGLGELSVNLQLSTAADKHARDLASVPSHSKIGTPEEHIGSDGSTYQERIEASGFLDRKHIDEKIGEGDGINTNPPLSTLDWHSDGICQEPGKLPKVKAICGGVARTVNISGAGNCSGYCDAGKLNMFTGAWITDINWTTAPDIDTDITITYYEDSTVGLEVETLMVGESVEILKTGMTIEQFVNKMLTTTEDAKNILTSDFNEIGVVKITGLEEEIGGKNYQFDYVCITFGYNDEHGPLTPPPIPSYVIVPFRINNMGPGS